MTYCCQYLITMQRSKSVVPLEADWFSQLPTPTAHVSTPSEAPKNLS